MLYNIVGLLSLVAMASGQACTNQGQTPNVNDGTNNYVIGYLGGFMGVAIPFPYAMEQCTSHSLDSTNTAYFKHSCMNGVVVTTEYTDSSCSTATGTKTVSQSISAYKQGELGYFECSGDNTFAQLNLVFNTAGGDGACNALQPIYAGLGACVDAFGIMGKFFSIYCDISTSTSTFEWFLGSAVKRADKRNLGVAMPVSSMEAYSSMMPYEPSSSMNPATTPKSAASCGSQNYCYDTSLTSTCDQVLPLGGMNGLWGQAGKCYATTTNNGGKGAVRTSALLIGGLMTAAAIAAF